MGHAYTPGLKVTRRAIVKKKRLLPIKGHVIVKKGDWVNPNDIIAKTELPGVVFPVNLANILGVLPSDVPGAMSFKLGERAKQGENIALSKSFFGLFKMYYKSPIDATVESVSNLTGQVILRGDPIPVNVKAYMKGKITEVIPEEGVIVENVGAYIQGIFGIGGETDGELCIISKSIDAVLDEKEIKPEHKDKIIVGGSLVTIKALYKAIEYGVRGIIVAGFEDQDLREILGYDLGVAITGTENLGTTLVVTEGFGKIDMAQKTFDLLNAHHGNLVSINGATQIRAGVIRPEIIIPLAEELKNDIPPAESKGCALAIGSSIRIIRSPHFGEIGIVTQLPPKPQQVDSETHARVLHLKLSSGEEVLVPRSNVEMIEG